MAHAAHFLTRLDRLAGHEVELALELYRDPELVGSVMKATALPDGAERIAISLEDATSGPFLVVTREGRFVTCLGRGMRPGDLPVVTRPQLDTAARGISRLREKMVLARQAKEGDRKTRHMLRRLFECPDAVSREDFLEVAAWEPLLGVSFLNTYIAMGSTLAEARLLLCRKRLRGSRANAVLHDYWNLLHATGHMALLGSITADRTRYAQATEGAENVRAALSYPLTGTGVVTFILKGAWAAGRLGKLMVPAYKRALAEDVALFELLDTLFALLALGTRSRRLRAEIQKAVRAAPGIARTPEARRLREKMGRAVEFFCQITADTLDAPPEELEAGLLRAGRTYLKEKVHSEEDPQLNDLLRTLPLMSWADGLTDGRKLPATFSLIAASARGAPEQFYLPRALLSEIRRPWRPADTWQVLEPTMKVERPRRTPVVRTASVGRNEPCSCGSGRKWKRCCGK